MAKRYSCHCSGLPRCWVLRHYARGLRRLGRDCPRRWMTNRIAPNVDVDNCGAPVPGRDTDSASLFCGHFAQVIGHSAVQAGTPTVRRSSAVRSRRSSATAGSSPNASSGAMDTSLSLTATRVSLMGLDMSAKAVLSARPRVHGGRFLNTTHAGRRAPPEADRCSASGQH